MTSMATRNAEMIMRAVQKSLPSTSKNSKTSVIDDSIAVFARSILSTEIEYVHCPQYSGKEFLKALKTKYTLLRTSKPKKSQKKRIRKKNRRLDNCDKNPSSMKNTELNGQHLSLPTAKIVLFSPDNVLLGWSSQLPVGSGFANLGTTCYINSTLQALFHVPSFVNWLKSDKKHEMSCEKMNGLHHSECIVCAMARTLQFSHRHTGSIRPKLILDKIKTICKHLSPYRQEDAHEFLRYLMEAMEKSYTVTLGIPTKKLDSYSKETTPLNQIFGGYIRTEVTCLQCAYVSTTFQHFQDLILDIRQTNIGNIYDALESYFSKERLDGDESYQCERCKKKVTAYKKFSIERAPNVLCIQLKRFNMGNFGGNKISKSIITPQSIDLSKFRHRKGLNSSAPLKYRMVSMVFHHGPSANSGHYTALGWTSSGSYYYFNDEQVFPVNFGGYSCNPNTYIMFYEREKPASINEKSLNVVKSTASNSNSSTAISLSNGCANGSVQPRANGFIPKREGPFPSTSHQTVANESVPNGSKETEPLKSPSCSYRQQPWGPVEHKENEQKPSQSQTQPPPTQPVKSLVVVPAAPAPIVKSSTNSLVPYTTASDSDNSDVEAEKNANDRRTRTDAENDVSAAGPSTLTPLAKRNSTLTSLLTSSPKNENHAYRPSLSNGKAAKSVGEKDSTAVAQNGAGNTKSSEERGALSFNLFGRDRKKSEAPHVRNNQTETRANGVGSTSNGKEVEDRRRLNESDVASTSSQTGRENVLSNGTKTNGLTNGNERTKVAMNGWIVTEIRDEERSTTSSAEKDSKSAGDGDWIVVHKKKKKSSSRDGNKFKGSGKCNGNSNSGDSHTENSSFQPDSQHASTHGHTYSSQNGYGGKVYTWNGDLSRLNRESEDERKEQLKRSYSYDDEIDRGKVKKAKYYNRNENCSSSTQSPRKNLIQIHHNQFNNAMSNGGSNNHNNNRGGKRWQFPQNGFHFGNGRRHPYNAHFRHHNHNYSYAHQRPGSFSNHSWPRR